MSAFSATLPTVNPSVIGRRPPLGEMTVGDQFRLAHLRFALMMLARAQLTTRWGRSSWRRRRWVSDGQRLRSRRLAGAAAGLDFARHKATARGLRLSLRQADADALPFADESFDYVLSWNVIFHGTIGDVGRRLAEIWRVLRPGGLYQGYDAVQARCA